jgi:predicted extracellular nuclease
MPARRLPKPDSAAKNRKTNTMKALASSLSILALLTAAAPGTVIISQYYEGTSNNKWIELYNTSSTAIDLTTDDYRLGLWSNDNREAWKSGTAPSSVIDLSVTIEPHDVVLIAHSSASDPTYASPDQSSGNVNFNGDDSMILYTGSTYAFANVVDAFGVTGSGYDLASFVRNNNILTGTNADFDASDWTEFTYAAVDAASSGNNEHLGTHIAVPETTATLFGGVLGLLALLHRRRTRHSGAK